MLRRPREMVVVSSFMYVSALVCFGLAIAMLPLSASFGLVEGVFCRVDGCGGSFCACLCLLWNGAWW